MSSTDNKLVSFSALMPLARHQKSISHAKEILHQLAPTKEENQRCNRSHQKSD